jgi:hypothetical protein
MAQKVEVRLVDDLDGGSADETVTFSLDGNEYEIDLSDEHATALRGEVWQYVQAARRVGKVAGRRGRTPAGTAAPSNRERNQAIREWAKSVGLEVSDRGRLSQEIVDRYDAEANA